MLKSILKHARLLLQGFGFRGSGFRVSPPNNDLGGSEGDQPILQVVDSSDKYTMFQLTKYSVND